MRVLRLAALAVLLLGLTAGDRAADAQPVRQAKTASKSKPVRARAAKSSTRSKAKGRAVVTLRTGKSAASKSAALAPLNKRLQSRDSKKFTRAFGFVGKLKTLRTKMNGVLVASTKGSAKPTRELAVAAIFTIMDRKYVRIGSEDYATRKESPSFGASSLRKEHVKVQGNTVRFDFPGKTGQNGKKVRWKFSITDPGLANAVRVFQGQPGNRLFSFPRSGRMVKVRAAMMRPLFKKFKALPKDLRTIGANREFKIAVQALEKKSPSANQADRLKISKQAKAIAASKLRHTPAMHQSNYLDPKVELAYVQTGRTGQGPPI